MSEGRKELTLAAAIVAIVAAGLFWGALSTGVTRSEETVEAGLFTERSLFCPGLPDGVSASRRISVGALGSEEVRVELEPRDEVPRDVLGEAGLFVEDSGTGASNIVGYGGAVGAGISQRFSAPGTGESAAPCSQRASRDWYLPLGSSARGASELIYLYNPFPDEAVVRITFFDENGAISKARLADVPVPAGETTTVRVNKFILQQRTLAARVSALRGRLVTWKTLFSETDLTSGVGTSLGATRPMPSWYFPAGAAGPGIAEQISLLNPSDEEAIVSISLIADENIKQPPELLEMTLPRHSARDISLARYIPDGVAGSVSAIVQSINKVEIVAERGVWYGEGAFSGVTTELGAPVPAPAWWLPPAVADPARDSVVVLNASENRVNVHLEFQGPEGPVSAQGVGSMNLEPGGRERIPLTGLRDAANTIAILRADGLVVAERLGYSSESGDIAAVMGLPIHAEPFSGDD